MSFSERVRRFFRNISVPPLDVGPSFTRAIRAVRAKNVPLGGVDAASAQRGSAPPNGPLTALETILAERAAIEAQIDAAARRGHVADALPISLLASFEAERVERRRLLGEDECRLAASLRRLDALCPVPPEPEPEPPARPRSRRIPRVGDWLPRDGAALPN